MIILGSPTTSNMEIFARLFGRGKRTEPSSPPLAPIGLTPTIANECMYRNRKRLDAITETYTRLINKEEETARMYARKKFTKLRNKHYKRYKDLVKKLEEHTDRVICLDNVIDIVRSIETADATLKDMQAAIEVFKSHASQLNEEKVDEILDELDTRHRELQTIQHRMAKPLGNVPVYSEAELDKEMEAFFEDTYEDEDEFEVADSEEEEEEAGEFKGVPLTPPDKETVLM